MHRHRVLPTLECSERLCRKGLHPWFRETVRCSIHGPRCLRSQSPNRVTATILKLALAGTGSTESGFLLFFWASHFFLSTPSTKNGSGPQDEWRLESRSA